MIGAPGRRWRAGAALIGAALAITLGGPAGAAHATQISATQISANQISATQISATDRPLTVTLTSLQPASVTPKNSITLAVVVRNTNTTTTYQSVRIRLRVNWLRMTSAQQLTSWIEPDAKESSTSTTIETSKTSRTLEPGRAAAFTLTALGESLHLGATLETFGAYGAAVEAVGSIGGDAPVTLGSVRTFIVWNPGPKYAPTHLALLAPITSQLRAGGARPDPALGAAWAGGGRLTKLLTTVTDPAFSWAVDPALLEAAAGPRGTPSSTSTTGTTSGAAATGVAPPGDAATTSAGAAWFAAFDRARAGHDVFALPYADTDVVAVGHTKAGFRHDHPETLLQQANAQAHDVTKTLFGTALPGGLVWPTQGRIDAAALRALPAGTRAVVLCGTCLTPDKPDVVPAALASIATGTGPLVTGPVVTAVRYDSVLSNALTTAGAADNSVLATQRMLAETAYLTSQSPLEGRHLLAAVPRGWAPHPAGVQAAVAALRSVPWVQLEPVTTLLGRKPGARAVPTGLPNYPAAARALELSTGHIAQVVNLERRITEFAPVLQTPGASAALITQTQRTALFLVGQAWRGSPAATLTASRRPLSDQVNRLYGGLTIPVNSAKNLLGQSAAVPITVTNNLDQPVSVTLVLRPRSGLLAVDHSVRVPVLAANSSKLVSVPIRAIANGNAVVDAQLTSSAGTVLVTSASFDIRVHSDWENRGILLIGVVTVLLLIVGLTRGVRRPREVVPPESVPDPDDIGAEPSPRAPPPPDDVPGPTLHRVDPAQRAAMSPVLRAIIESGPSARAATLTSPPPPAPTQPAPTQPAPTLPGAADSSLGASSALMAAGTLLSRILGLVRVVVLGWAIGFSAVADSFTTANTLPNNLFILIGGGVLNAVLVPQIVAAARRSDGGKDYTDRLLTLAIAILGGATVLAVAAAPLLIRLYSSACQSAQSGQSTQSVPSAQFELGTAFALWCLPQIFFYGLYTIYGQVLNARNSFGPYMWAPVINNVVAITGTLVFIGVAGAHGNQGITVAAMTFGRTAILAGTATLGVVAQALVLVPVLRRSGYTWRPRWGVRGMGFRPAGRVAGWTFAAVAIGQLGFVEISRVANGGGCGGGSGRSVYDTAYLLFMLPHSLVAVSVVTAVFTRMSRSALDADVAAVRADVSLAVRLTGTATVFATAAFVVLGRDLTLALFPGNDAAKADDIALVTIAMILGLVPFSAQYLFQRVFYAHQDARTPFTVQLVIITVWTLGSLICGIVLPHQWVVTGVAVSMSVANILGVAVTIVLLRRRIGGLDGRRVLTTHLRLTVGAALAGSLTWAVVRGVHLALGDHRAVSYLALVLGGATLLGTYASALRMLHVTELAQLTAPVTTRLGHRLTMGAPRRLR